MRELRHHLNERLRVIAMGRPRLFYAIAPRMFGDKLDQRAVRPGTDIVIEGFPRSANTFAVLAFRDAQRPRRMVIAHHLHAAAQIVEGARQGLPVLMMVREPQAAVRSLVVMYPELKPDHALGRWIGFYRVVLPVISRVVVADFADVITDFGAVIDRVNARHGTDFARFEHCEDALARIERQLHGIRDRGHGGSDLKISYPTDAKRRAHSEIALDLDPRRLAQARALHARLLGAADG